jgi:hypothetical protein
MGLSKKAFALFLLASLTAGQAQASDQAFSINIPTDKVANALTELAKITGDKVLKLLAEEDLDRVIGAFGLSGVFAALSYLMYKDIERVGKYHSPAENTLMKLTASTVLILSAMLGVKGIEMIYNA